MPFGDPLIAFFAITLTAVVYTAISNVLLKKLGDKKRQKFIQDEMNRINKLAIDVGKSGDEKRKKEAEEQQGRIPDLLKESMVLQFKPLVVTLPIFFAASWAMRQAFPTFQVKLAFAIPVVIQNLDRFPNWRDTFGVVGWFILAIIFGGMLMQFVVGKLEEQLAKRKAAAK